MKGFVIGVIATMSMMAAGAQAGLFDSVATNGWPAAEVKKYKVPAYGFDVRAYDWKRTDGKICTMAFSQKGPVGLDCE